ncbi:MAG: hypothetical protein KC609_20410 [Myxococcales bacterium]|nr:hypothetical protein [Myxococcales bacterium]
MSVIIIISIVALIPIAVLVVMLMANQRLVGHYRVLARNLGLELETRRRTIFSDPFIRGTFRGRAVEIERVRRNQGENTRPHAFVKVECKNPGERVLLIYPKVLKLMGFKFDIDASIKLKQFQTGDADFDNQFIVKTNSEAFALKLLSQPVRSALCKSNCMGGISYTPRGLFFEQPGDLDTELQRQRIEEMIPQVAALADKIAS